MALAGSKYNPWEIAPEDRKASFVGRGGLLHRLLEVVREQEGRRTIQHYLLLGPRGIGKTTLLLMLRDAVRGEPKFRERWFCVQLREEEFYVYTLRDLFSLVIEALHVDEGVQEAGAVRESAEAEPDEEKSMALMIAGLRGICRETGKKILLLLDNFDRMFPKWGSEGERERAMRRLLSTEDWLMLVGTSVEMFEEIAAYDDAFFNFFAPMHVENLGDADIRRSLAGQEE